LSIDNRVHLHRLAASASKGDPKRRNKIVIIEMATFPILYTQRRISMQKEMEKTIHPHRTLQLQPTYAQPTPLL